MMIARADTGKLGLEKTVGDVLKIAIASVALFISPTEVSVSER